MCVLRDRKLLSSRNGAVACVSGRLMDSEGNLVNWWSAESERKFEQRAQCLVDQYSQYMIDDIHVSINDVNRGIPVQLLL